MAFVIEAARERQERRYKGDWKVCRRTGAELLMIPGVHPEFRKAIRAKEKSARARLGLLGKNAEKPLPDDVSEQIWREAISEVLIRDWRKVDDPEGNARPYTSALCAKVLEEIDDFRLDVVDLLNAEAELDSETAEAVEKN